MRKSQKADKQLEGLGNVRAGLPTSTKLTLDLGLPMAQCGRIFNIFLRLHTHPSQLTRFLFLFFVNCNQRILIDIGHVRFPALNSKMLPHSSWNIKQQYATLIGLADPLKVGLLPALRLR